MVVNHFMEEWLRQFHNFLQQPVTRWKDSYNGSIPDHICENKTKMISPMTYLPTYSPTTCCQCQPMKILQEHQICVTFLTPPTYPPNMWCQRQPMKVLQDHQIGFIFLIALPPNIPIGLGEGLLMSTLTDVGITKSSSKC
jgi:hypothetical protein